uniref:Variant surface glycoprotein 1125.4218 n=1 Tax=Trypanosoma brucei TaxID=5691 RepID=A0A1J0RA51_9TRYP|nr:variant surface glycoprotein 1125.4218 [Trypanosoma brucei]
MKLTRPVRTYLIATLLLLTQKESEVSADEDLGKAGKKVTTLCKEAALFDLIAYELREKLVGRSSAINELQKQADRWRLGAYASTGTIQTRRLLALAAYADRKAKEAAKQQASFQAAILDFYRAASVQAGALTGTETALQHTLTGPTGTPSSSSAHTADIVLTASAGSNIGCEDAATTIKEADDGATDWKTIKQLPITDKAEMAKQLTGFTLTLGGCNSDGSTCDSSGSTNLYAGTGSQDKTGKLKLHGSANSAYLTIKNGQQQRKTQAAPTPTDVGQSKASPDTCRTAVEQTDKRLLGKEQLAHLFCMARNYAKQPDPRLQALSGATLAGNAEFLEIAAPLLSTTGAAFDLSDTNQAAKLKQIVTAAYLGSENEFTGAFVTAIDAIEVTYLAGKNPKKNMIKNIIGTPDAATATAFLEADNFEKKEKGITQKIGEEATDKTNASADKAEEKKDGDNKTTAAECVATEEGKCDKNKCTWDKEKNSAKLKRERLLFQL